MAAEEKKIVFCSRKRDKKNEIKKRKERIEETAELTLVRTIFLLCVERHGRTPGYEEVESSPERNFMLRCRKGTMEEEEEERTSPERSAPHRKGRGRKGTMEEEEAPRTDGS